MLGHQRASEAFEEVAEMGLWRAGLAGSYNNNRPRIISGCVENGDERPQGENTEGERSTPCDAQAAEVALAAAASGPERAQTGIGEGARRFRSCPRDWQRPRRSSCWEAKEHRRSASCCARRRVSAEEELRRSRSRARRRECICFHALRARAQGLFWPI